MAVMNQFKKTVVHSRVGNWKALICEETRPSFIPSDYT
jgi:hypothetical protein